MTSNENFLTFQSDIMRFLDQTLRDNDYLELIFITTLQCKLKILA